ALREHLFPPPDRSGVTGRAAPVLRTVQNAACAWCARPVRSGSGHVDHVMPWSRTWNDAIENLALCHKTCNERKSDRFLSPALLAARLDFLEEHRDELELAAASASLVSDLR